MFSTVTSGGLSGIVGYPVQVEVDASQGLPGFQMVGYLSNEVKEAKERVRVALKNAGFHLPAMCFHVNLSPADVRKEGTGYDLPVAVGILASLAYVEAEQLTGVLVLGELGLNGEVKPVKGVLPIIRMAEKQHIHTCIVPRENAKEGAVISGVKTVGVSSLEEIMSYLTADEGMRDTIIPPEKLLPEDMLCAERKENAPDFSEINGQAMVKRAAEIAAAGFHNLLMVGPPGSGKTMIAKRIPGILPPLTMEESLEVTTIYSVAGMLNAGQALVTERPFVNPHHTITEQALVGGGVIPRPGAISKAHRGVLFLDGYFYKNAETPNLRALWRFSYLEFFKKSAKTNLHTTFWNFILPLFDCPFAIRFMTAVCLMAKLYTIWQKEITKWRNYTRMAKGERAYGI